MSERTIEYKGGGFVTVTEPSEKKQMSTEQVEALVENKFAKSHTLLTVNNGTDTRLVNPRMREHRPDHRVYTLQVTWMYNKQNRKS